MNPELSNPEKFVGSLYPRKCDSYKTSLANSFRKRILANLLPRMVFKCIAHEFQLSKSFKKPQNKIGRITVVLHVLTIIVQDCAV